METEGLGAATFALEEDQAAEAAQHHGPSTRLGYSQDREVELISGQNEVTHEAGRSRLGEVRHGEAGEAAEIDQFIGGSCGEQATGEINVEEPSRSLDE